MTKLTNAMLFASTPTSPYTGLIALLILVSVTLCSPVSFAVSYQVSTIETGEGGQQTILAEYLSATDDADLVMRHEPSTGPKKIVLLVSE